MSSAKPKQLEPQAIDQEIPQIHEIPPETIEPNQRPSARLKKVIDSDDDLDIAQFAFQEQGSSTTARKSNSSGNSSSVKVMVSSQKLKLPLKQAQQVQQAPVSVPVPVSAPAPVKDTKGDNLDDFDDSTPSWAQLGKSKDKNMKLHGTSEADPCTLYIPEGEFKKLTKAMMQYWRVKSDNFDKIIFFKLGKFYELFYEDALVGHRHLDLNWMGRKMHTGFPEKCLNKYANMLLDLGYKVAVVDQTETPDMMEKRVSENRKSGIGNVDKLVNRELTQVLTKGTYMNEEGDSQGPDERILMVIRKYIVDSTTEHYGVVMLERSTNIISFAHVSNIDKSYEQLKSMLLLLRPVEIVIDTHNIPQHDPLSKMIRGDALKVVISPLAQKGDNWDARKGLFNLAQVYNEQFPEAVEHFKENQLVMQAFSGLTSYLNQILILDRVLECAKFKVYDPEISVQQHMILGSQALYHLEILESPGSTKQQDYSLLGVINKTVTSGGYRLLKRWLCAPLYQLDAITTRQQAIKDITRFRKERELFRSAIKHIPDLERLCCRIYEYSVKTASKAVFYENLSQTRLKEFRTLTQKLREAQTELELLGQLSPNFKSARLIELLKIQNGQNGGYLPDVKAQLDDFENYIKWDGNTPQPIQGIMASYDDAQAEVKLVEDKFQEYLFIIRKQFNNNRDINYAHTKFRYELEIPAHLVEHNKPNDFEFTSVRAGFKRFHTKKLKDMVTELEETEKEQKKQLTLFVQFVFKNFRNNYVVWDQLVSVLSELDALCSMSVFGETCEGIMCWPEFSTGEPKLVITDGVHPCLLGINFVPNTIDMGNANEKFLLLTGPNMGGKSTTLRMTCVLTILAQIGSMVPCSAMQLTLVDRIFTRIGAKDHLMEGKSTFYVELEETLMPLKYATKHSLFITDELGRGTSTYDGVAIACAVMYHMVDRIACRVLFATHFRILVEEAKLIKGVSNVHMACYVEGDRVVFLYRLRPGECPASFGINVAKAVGIHSSIIKRAQEMSDSFENKSNVKNAQKILQEFNELISEVY